MYKPVATQSNNQIQQNTPSQTPQNNEASVNIINFSFNPAELTVTTGTKVTWTNNDNASHQIKSDTFSSELLSKGQSFSYTFDDKGSYNYHCSVHPSMIGKIIVE